ncbi:hypothetical protein DL96DRAFT_239368 [Flagelloscypha sp. PMI_526]|nr:hypothetical protein DL96DRAFT_239368 [Flagelloscypha sp. PMI_526]
MALSMEALLASLSFIVTFLLVAFFPPIYKKDRRAVLCWTAPIVGLLFILNLINGISVVIQSWKHNGEVFCDISSTFTLVLWQAALACILPATRAVWEESYGPNLQYKTVLIPHTFWRWCDPTITFFFPILYGLLQFFVKTHRFDIVETYGCFPSYYDSAFGLSVILAPLSFFSYLAILHSGDVLKRVYALERSDRAKLLIFFALPMFFMVWFFVHIFTTNLLPETSFKDLHQLTFSGIAFRADFEHKIRHITLWWVTLSSGFVTAVAQILQVTSLDDIFLVAIFNGACQRFFQDNVLLPSGIGRRNRVFARIRSFKYSAAMSPLAIGRLFRTRFDHRNTQGDDIEMQSSFPATRTPHISSKNLGLSSTLPDDLPPGWSRIDIGDGEHIDISPLIRPPPALAKYRPRETHLTPAPARPPKRRRTLMKKLISKPFPKNDFPDAIPQTPENEVYFERPIFLPGKTH